ncbi:MAG: hypothetical protein A3J09_01695 [Candidatus Zambryskibacteria bacterium RIFCSPLOWO2_02_FULL_51_21]|uniref:Vitamin K epoxide reductase domain-containing protein n=1 Tax=Candidatus Zambryskibacteria bacterium RIFCSPHIGHO2_02_FULL_43_37 TaxID=1802749 RepID=A0A1G2TGQ8_9BACT|nr:MAG: hypothetical protein A2723_01695 [Candidatus Zambryskibacteria bacterium RIFCSPHIGHO2_01_FULL_52_18]OHA96484.1 MAG: hypothetical protein A3D49_01205 [Candidatus Zambryskibacteria bacterium RIFCSPHIGHO2_02_FULL_43_37]OHB07154.1 MAG: hypothetical protein A2944_00970 [Candidatus Zambryskibacteria bacterium RIFCSPLOWO2_01_FULL_52_12]OHB11253.1 MAG: hypothetical protein A3J09_01695 [Candidatus Zambryskibacteria bacterium RIFCSPLOWO2_02_FULL_51_21]
MTHQFYRRAAFILSLLGVLFSGYLSGIKFFTSTCAFNESCPIFLGLPACYFGFALFLILFITSLMLLMGKTAFARAVKVNTFFSGLGVLFAGYFAYPEVRDMLAGTLPYRFFGLTTCAYGFVFFALVFFISVWAMNKKGYN